jgi:thioredoxin reductase
MWHDCSGQSKSKAINQNQTPDIAFTVKLFYNKNKSRRVIMASPATDRKLGYGEEENEQDHLR